MGHKVYCTVCEGMVPVEDYIPCDQYEQMECRECHSDHPAPNEP